MLLKQGSSGPDVVTWQKVLGVTADGSFGPATKAATIQWQSDHGLTADGVVGDKTWSAAGLSHPSTLPALGRTTIAAVKGIDKLSTSDLKALVKAANWIGINPDWLASVISFETGHTFSPSIKNAAGSGATGLIQFMPSTARNLGTTTDDLARMTFSEQLEWVKKYFSAYRGKLHSLEDTYLVVFDPSLIGKSMDTTVPDSFYAQNKGFDFNSDGEITKNEITTTIRSVLNQAGDTRIIVPLIGVGTIVFGGLLAFAAYELFKES